MTVKLFQKVQIFFKAGAASTPRRHVLFSSVTCTIISIIYRVLMTALLLNSSSECGSTWPDAATASCSAVKKSAD